MRAREFIVEVSDERLQNYLSRAGQQVDRRMEKMAQVRDRLNKGYEIYHAEDPTRIVHRFEAGTPAEARRYYEKYNTNYESDRDYDLKLRRSTGLMEDAFRGIDISMERDDDEIMVRASTGDKQLGSVLFVDYDGELMPQDLEVDERYRGQGIAAAMYDYVKSLGYKIRRSGQQTDAGAGFWAKHRPDSNVWEQGVSEGSLNEYRDQLWAWIQSKFPSTQWPEYVQRDFLYAKAKGNQNQKDLEDFSDEIQRDFGRVRWRLEKLPITLDIFTPKTQRMIKEREGGSSNPYQVPKDTERHALQQKMIQQKGVSQEPIIVAKLSNGYDLIEGWHRTIQHLKAYPQGYTGPAWVGYGATYTSESKQGVAEGTDDIKKKMSKLEALALAANRAGDDAKCKMYQQKIQSLKQKLSKDMSAGVTEVKIGPEITGRSLLFKAAAMAMRDAGREGITLDYDQAIKQASRIYGIPYQPSELPKLLAQRAEIDRQLALLKQGKQVAKQRRQEKRAPTPAGAEEYWRTHALPTDRIKPPTKTLEEMQETPPEVLRALDQAAQKNGYKNWADVKANPRSNRAVITVAKLANEIMKTTGPHHEKIFYKSKTDENFADGKVKGKSRPGRVKRAGASCNGSVTDLRARAKNASGEKAKMYHWCANMKSGKKKSK